MHLVSVHGNTQLAQILKAITKEKNDLTPYPLLLTSQLKTIRMTKSLWKPQSKRNKTEKSFGNQVNQRVITRQERCKVISKLSENRCVYSNYRNSIKITHNNILKSFDLFIVRLWLCFFPFSLKPIQFHLNVTNLTQLTWKPLFSFHFISLFPSSPDVLFRLFFPSVFFFIWNSLANSHVTFPACVLTACLVRVVCVCLCAAVNLSIFNHNRHQLTNCFAVCDSNRQELKWDHNV